ncbi:VOC family protein [Mameliella sediminis]|uniref:VOC family protein n=1 Tax=Mameliella sediminis TaxID=2836866 RepID=UPI001C47FFF0|nr:VOC family protein [Mameliella sediminis]MBV7394194.1 VOC family protein [Mameliella sediminis]
MSAPLLSSVLETAIYVDDLDAAEGFYGTMLGLERITRVDGRHVFFRCGASVVLTFLAEATEQPPAEGALPVPPHGARGPGHLCFAVPGEDLNAMVAHLTAQGIEIESDFNWPHGPRSVYVRDPAGNSVEFADPSLWGTPA